ncbi:MAG: DUF3465 domain-containing protein [Ruminococcus sp.]|jgi:hypothetical protein|nr:DUF3465 domain-containing protein [Ruminococcus sp.]
MEEFVVIVIIAVIILLSLIPKIFNDNQKPKHRRYSYGNRRYRSNNRFQRYGVGRVVKLLNNDFSTDHQKFIIKTAENETLLITHNIVLAPELYDLKVGDVVEFYGECFQTDRGYGIHYTHHSTSRRHTSGYLRHNNKMYM